MSTKEMMLEKMCEALGRDNNLLLDEDLGNFVNVVVNIFCYMDVAEEEIARAMSKYPDRAEQINKIFIALQPSEVLMNKSQHVYRAHVRELCERAGQGKSLSPGTDAEIISALAEIGLLAPLNRSTVGMIFRLFRRLFPDYSFGDDFETIVPPSYFEEYAGQLDEMEADARARLTNELRVVF